MDAALGPPEQMAEHSEELTPMMRQYFDLCGQYEDSLVLFQVGDFYETFCEAAERSARILEITLTQREDNTGTYPMAGIPIDNAEPYIETLLEAGYRVAVADQVQDPADASGVVERAVTRVVTPGTLTEDELLHGADNNFVACLTREGNHGNGDYGLAVLDVSTGDFYATTVETESAATDEISRFAPAEAIVAPEAPETPFDADCMVTGYEESAFDIESASELVTEYFGPPERLLATDAEIRACGALLAYAEYVRGGERAMDEGSEEEAETAHLDYLNHLTRYDPRSYMLVDAVALSSLELFESRAVHGKSDATLVGILDETACALGSRRLKDWLRRPLLDQERIEKRLDAVEELTTRVQQREEVHDLLRDVYDIERLISRVARGRANARDLRSLKSTLDVVPKVADAMEGVESETLRTLHGNLDEMADVRDRIGRAITEEPPIEITEGGVIKSGYDDELAQLRETERSGKEWIDDLEKTERERTGIGSLKVGFNQVHGYYIEVTNPNLDKVPDDYNRRQTLKNSERFYTPELKQREDEIIRAEGRADDLEYDLFCEVRSRIAGESERVQALADTLAELDVLVSLAEVAAKHGYSRPEIGGEGIEIRNGRHPVVERTETSFVPNDTNLDRDTTAVITGPNMSGKSTYMRQVALITLLAQVGSFVPADEARLELVDRIFTRVGASDDIAGGRSTFMVEMTEVADILRNATPKSLILLDEVGRGTSTTDGFAIARSVTEHIHDEIGAKTLFATHHHDLTAVADELPNAVNLHFGATEHDDEVVFEHDISPGATMASYGIEVAQVAGVPDSVIRRSKKLLKASGDCDGSEAEKMDVRETSENPMSTDTVSADVLAELKRTNVADTTPLEALQLLDRLKGQLD
ncbi:DNA mismatch repair protein MutS [Haladaptatus litoreus]|uniref:DNA mismatch repair protein MutS n=1 Tax=Haladaptatus litoreus TaxID=553468 RepID=A0A1N6VYC9_9EURY|nr:DNA mismatch repair protein MutS [Haladaptatus litoreus]SIQ82834.1 DNA mismatch repair protein MutS [Haladaptatus litoreus]